MADNKIEVNKLEVWYEGVHAIKRLSLEVKNNEIPGVIGPSNSGKTSFLRTLNRMNELYPNSKTEGRVAIDGRDIFRQVDILQLRKRVGIVFAKGVI